MIRTDTMAVVAMPNATMPVGTLAPQDVLTLGHIVSLPANGGKYDPMKYPELHAVLKDRHGKNRLPGARASDRTKVPEHVDLPHPEAA